MFCGCSHYYNCSHWFCLIIYLSVSVLKIIFYFILHNTSFTACPLHPCIWDGSAEIALLDRAYPIQHFGQYKYILLGRNLSVLLDQLTTGNAYTHSTFQEACPWVNLSSGAAPLHSCFSDFCVIKWWSLLQECKSRSQIRVCLLALWQFSR